jgi:hypothetical protein
MSMTQRRFAAAVATVLGLLATVPARAHHSAIQFDFAKTVQMSGVVMRFQAINPHMRLTLRISDAKGTREIAFEGHSTNNMYRGGYRDKMIQVGDTITVTVAPLKDGSDGGYVTGGVTSKGERFGLQGAADRARERDKAEGK